MTPNQFKVGSWVVNDETYNATSGSKVKKLTRQEFVILMLLARNAESVVPREKLMLPSKRTRTSRTIDTHICRIRKMLGLDADVIESVHGQGYCLHRERRVQNLP